MLKTWARERSGEPRGELPFHVLGLGAQHRLADAAELAGERGVDVVADFGLLAGLGRAASVEVAVSRPTMPSGVPSTLASISRGSSARITSTVTLNLNFM